MPSYTGEIIIKTQPLDSYEVSDFLAPVAILSAFIRPGSNSSEAVRRNPHNLPVDPVSTAIAHAMGLDWKEIVATCSSGDDGISLVFQEKESGPHRITLPASHPSRHTHGDEPEHFIRCGNQSISILVDDRIFWQCHREWPKSDGSYTDYVDTGTLDLPKSHVPAAVMTVYNAQVKAGQLTLDQILSWKDASIPKAKVKKIEVSGDYFSFFFNFPKGEGGESTLA